MSCLRRPSSPPPPLAYPLRRPARRLRTPSVAERTPSAAACNPPPYCARSIEDAVAASPPNKAKEEAEKEIAQYRVQVEAQFQKKVAESSRDSGANVKRLEQETEGKIRNIKSQASTTSNDVQMLLKHATTIKN